MPDEPQDGQPTEGSAGEGGDEKVEISKAAFDNMKGAADRASDSAKEAAALKRENVILRTVPGANLEADDVKALINSNLDDDTVVNMVRALTTPGEKAPPKGPDLEDGETQSTDERTRLAAGADAGGEGGGEPNPHESAVKAFRDHIDNGGKKDDAFAIAISKVMGSTDPRALVPPDQRADLAELMRAGMS